MPVNFKADYEAHIDKNPDNFNKTRLRLGGDNAPEGSGFARAAYSLRTPCSKLLPFSLGPSSLA